jgi:hypothetical protein
MLSQSLYQPLRGGEIRLLTIRSQSNFTLENAYLRDNPYYVAISYCWGDVKDLCNVRVNDYEVQLRGHVYTMLRNLYHKYQVTRLWLDMVCIDQSNTEERNHQVGLMNQIYSQAQEVLIWLGPGSPNTDDAMSTLRYHKPGNLLKRNDLWTLLPLFRLEYWNRMWIVQEVGLARRLTIHCGLKSVDWTCLSYLEGSMPDSLPAKSLVSKITNCLALKLDRHRQAWKENGTSLSELLVTCRDCECSDPRDKVYALLGFAGDCAGNALQVDYSKSLFMVYDDVIRFHHARSLILDGSDERPNDTVQFSLLLQYLFRSPYQMEHSALQAMESPNPLSASLLVVTGSRAGTISEIGPTFSSSDLAAIPGLVSWRYHDLDSVVRVDSTASFACTGSLDRSLPTTSTSIARQATYAITSDPYYCFFRTDSGQVGIGPTNIRPGDAICQFSHSDVSASIRYSTPQKWTIVGGVFVSKYTPDQRRSKHEWSLRDWACFQLGPIYSSDTIDLCSKKSRILVYLDIFTLQSLTQYRRPFEAAISGVRVMPRLEYQDYSRFTGL